MDWKTTDAIENEFFKLNPIMERLHDIEVRMTHNNADIGALTKELNRTLYKLEDQQGVIFNMIDQQRNK
ncbi:MAG TPA: hypothetical protein K8V00_11410 [Ligilactobacillus acidipiscis]|uniref:Uncharacterized protein n=1 Tax=Ligilactobacillus acidipiscis TaxID=89059 RepID=A0A921K1M9_9LACO|nr:hypothetical protein [Ligilactobacillus acidipiscis]